MKKDANEFLNELKKENEMKNIMLKIHTVQDFKDQEPDVIDLMTEGFLYKKAGAIYLTYDESEISEIAGNRVILKIKDNDYVQMNRFGEFETEMVFKEKRRDVSIYATPYGEFKVETLTDRLTVNLDETKGDICIEYTVSISGSPEVKNILTISYYEN